MKSEWNGSMTMSSRHGQTYITRILQAMVINMSMGILYIWGIFLLPLEGLLPIGRASLSLVPSVALVSFTVGMVIHSHLLGRFGERGLSAIAFALAAVGHLIFALEPGFSTLLLGYGLMFGLGAGLGYGLALTIATTAPKDRRATAIGFTMASFVATGIVIPLVFGPLIAETSVTRSFGAIGMILAVIGGLATISIRSVVTSQHDAQPGDTKKSPSLLGSGPFLLLAAIFFLICFVGLFIVSQVTGIIVSNGLSRRIGDFGPVLFTLGYLVGSLSGGRVVERLSGRSALMVSGAISGIGVLGLFGHAALLPLGGAALIGAVFGGSASLMPMLIGEVYGAKMIAKVYGQLMIAYGAAGLLAPWMSGLLFSLSQSYSSSLFLALAMSLAVMFLAPRFRLSPPARVQND
jgi:OFA family oxalate/formate antiporter-like MFS transporter